MARTLSIALTAVAVTGLTLLTASSPALAFVSPPTLTFAQPANTEYSDAVVNGECPVLTTSIDLTAVVVGDPTVYDISAGVNYDGATGLVSGSAVINALPPGTDIVVTLTCRDATNAEIAHVDDAYTVNDQGAASAATAAGLNSPITVAGDCGAGTGVTTMAFRFDVNGTDPAVYPNFPYPGSPWSFDMGVTPTDIGAKLGDTVLVSALCVINGSPQILVAASSSTLVVASAAALPATGTDIAGPALGATLVLVLGAVLVLLRRRTRSASSATLS